MPISPLVHLPPHQFADYLTAIRMEDAEELREEFSCYQQAEVFEQIIDCTLSLIILWLHANAFRQYS